MFDIVSVIIGAVVATGVVGFVAHKWPGFFASKVDSSAVAVNSGLSKVETAVGAEVTKVEAAVKAKL